MFYHLIWVKGKIGEKKVRFNLIGWKVVARAGARMMSAKEQEGFGTRFARAQDRGRAPEECFFKKT